MFSQGICLGVLVTRNIVSRKYKKDEKASAASPCQWGFQALLIRPAAVEKKLFLWQGVLVLMDSSVRLEYFKKFVWGVQVLEGWQIAANHLLRRANDTLQCALLLDSGSSVADGDGGSEDGLNDGGVEVNHNWLWQIELLQLLQQMHPLGFLGEGADVHVSPASRAASMKWQEACDPPAGGVRYTQPGLVLQQSWDDGIKSGAGVYKQDPGIGSWGDQVLEDKIEGHVYCIV